MGISKSYLKANGLELRFFKIFGQYISQMILWMYCTFSSNDTLRCQSWKYVKYKKYIIYHDEMVIGI